MHDALIFLANVLLLALVLVGMALLHSQRKNREKVDVAVQEVRAAMAKALAARDEILACAQDRGMAFAAAGHCGGEHDHLEGQGLTMEEAKNHSRVTPEGRMLGFQTARLVEPAVAELVRQGEPDERCKSCAGTYGTVPNGCLQTQADFVKAVIEDVPFLCHQANRKGWPCHAWFAARVHLKDKRGTCPWDFSPPDEKSEAPR